MDQPNAKQTQNLIAHQHSRQTQILNCCVGQSESKQPLNDHPPAHQILIMFIHKHNAPTWKLYTKLDVHPNLHQTEHVMGLPTHPQLMDALSGVLCKVQNYLADRRYPSTFLLKSKHCSPNERCFMLGLAGRRYSKQSSRGAS